MQDRRAPAGERALEGGRERLGRLHRLAMTAEGAGERGEIGAGERCRGDPAGEGAFLVHPDRPIDAVVHHHHDQRDPVMHRGREFLPVRSEEHTSELQSLMRISYAVFCLKKKNKIEPILPNTYYMSSMYDI